MRLALLSIASAATLGLSPADAMAATGADCLYDALKPEQRGLVLDAALAGAPEPPAGFKEIGDACMAEHGWTKPTGRVAAELFIARVMVERYTAEAQGMGISEEQLRAITDGLGDDLKEFVGEGGISDPVASKLTGLIMAQGLPTDEKHAMAVSLYVAARAMRADATIPFEKL